MGQAMDFDKLRKKRRRTQLIKRVSILAAILIVIVGVMSLNNILIHVNILNSLSDFFQGLGGSGYPIPAPGGTIRSTKHLENDLVVLNDTNLYIYSNKGKELLNAQRMSDSTILLTGGGRALTYDIGGAKFQIHSRSNLLLDGESEYALNMAALGESGAYALICSSKQYTTQITVYDSRFDQQFQWFSNELVTGVGLSPKGDRLAAGTVGASGGVMQSTVFLFAFDRTSEIAKTTFSDELILSVSYTDETHMGVLTDRNYYVLDGEGQVVGSVSLGGSHISDSASFDGNLILLCVNAETRSQTVVLIGPRGEELGRITPDHSVWDLAVGKTEAYLLTDEGIAVYDHTLALRRTEELMGVSRIQATGDALYCFTAQDIYPLDEQAAPSAGARQRPEPEGTSAESETNAGGEA